MANKLAALFAVLLVAAHAATAFRTTITTVETAAEEENWTSQECQRQIRGTEMRKCLSFLQEEQRSPYGRRGTGGSGESRDFYECCDELRNIRNERCRCEALQAAMERSAGRQEMRGLLRTAETLPQMCGVGPRTCSFQSPWF